MNPLLKVMFDKLLAERFSNNYCNIVECCILSGFESRHSLSQALSCVPYGPNLVQSSGRNLCAVWGGNVIKEMPFLFATMMAGIDNWDSFLSKSKRFGSSLSDISHAIKMLQIVNNEPLI